MCAFSVRKVVFKFLIVDSLAQAASDESLVRHLSHVFYGVSKDGNHLVSVTIGLHRTLPNPFEGRQQAKNLFWKKAAKRWSAIEDKVQIFSIYGAEDTIPTYDQLTLKRFDSVRQTFKR